MLSLVLLVLVATRSCSIKYSMTVSIDRNSSYESSRCILFTIKLELSIAVVLDHILRYELTVTAPCHHCLEHIDSKLLTVKNVSHFIDCFTSSSVPYIFYGDR